MSANPNQDATTETPQNAADPNAAFSKKKVSKATAWSLAAEFSGSLITPITNMILARIIAPEIFGVVATINMIVYLSNVFTEAGFQLYVVQREFKDDDELTDYASVALWTSLGIGAALFAAIFGFRDALAAFVGSPGYGTEVAVASLTIPLVAVASVLQAIFKRTLNYKPLFLRRVIALAVPFAVTVPLALCGAGCWSLIIGTLATNVVNVVVLTIGSMFRPRFFYRWRLLAEMAPFCLTTMFGYWAAWATNWLDIFIVGNILGPYYTGLYKNTQATVTGIIATITASLTPILFSVLCRYQNDREKFTGAMVEFTEKLCVFLAPLGFGIFCCRRLITLTLLGEKWLEAADFIGVWGLATTALAVYATYCRDACRAKGKPQLGVVAQLLALAVIIPTSYFSAKIGFETMVYARSAAALSLIFFYYVIIYFALKINPWRLIRVTILPIFCALIMSAGVLGVLRLIPGTVGEIVGVAVGIAIYSACICVSKRTRTLYLAPFATIKRKLKRG